MLAHFNMQASRIHTCKQRHISYVKAEDRSSSEAAQSWAGDLKRCQADDALHTLQQGAHPSERCT